MLPINIGLDPEVFATIILEEEQYAISPSLLEKFSSLECLREDKEQKHPIYIDEKDFSWMMDGVAFETTFKKIFKDPKDLYDTIGESLISLTKLFNGLSFQGLNINLYKKPVVNIKPEMYFDYLDENKIHQGFIFGCDPDEDAIDTGYRCQTLDVFSHPFRYGGGHIHISGLPEFKDNFITAIRLQSITTGNFCIANSPYPELERQRATTYGRPGRFRPQKYPNGDIGIEYRSPSNSWISLPESKMQELFYWINLGCEFLLDRKKSEKIIDTYLYDTVSAITMANKELAEQTLKSL
jgi:hypothetical protein